MREREVQHREWSKWEATTREMDLQTVLHSTSFSGLRRASASGL